MAFNKAGPCSQYLVGNDTGRWWLSGGSCTTVWSKKAPCWWGNDDVLGMNLGPWGSAGPR